MLDDLERLANDLSDSDPQWWPFLFVRPERHELFSSRRVLALAALYGLLAGLFVNVLARLGGGVEARTLHPLLFPTTATLAFFALYRFTFAAAWNRRVERIRRGERP
jgi:hypothetical protein